MSDTEDFNPLSFEKKLTQLKDTQECIQGLSSWCLKQRSHHKKIVASWLNVLKRVKVEQRLVLFYLANDVIQYSKRKNYEFVESWGLNLQKATPLVRDDKVRPKILRIFKIWEQRSVYDDEFLSDLTGLLSAGAVKKTDDDPLDFQPQQLVNKIKQCQDLETDTDQKLKHIHDCPLQLSDTEALCIYLKDNCHREETGKELNDSISRVEKYTQALQREIVAREALLAMLSSANQYYSTQRGEVKVVAYAYKNFGSRVRALKRKLDELIPTLPNAAPSPPARDEDVPSPGPDEDLELPPPADHEPDDDLSYNIDRTFNTSLAADGSLYNLGLSSFLTSDNPMALFNDGNELVTNSSNNKIEVLNTRPNEKQDFNINDFLKTFAPSETNNATPDNNSVGSATLSQKSQDTLPGLDLLTPETPGNPAPPTSFYGSIDLISDDPEPYVPESNNTWNNSAWSMPAPPAPPTLPSGLSLGLHLSDTPESPPPAPAPVPPVTRIFTPVQDMPPLDVDHRGLLPPPPPPPVLPGLLGHMEDVDHRLLPPVPPPVPPPVTNLPGNRHPVVHQDVDHRNLIPLTHQPPVPVPLNHPPPPVPAPVPRPINHINLDQDYRVPPMAPPLITPSDIVESVDMDLSEDEEQQGMYNPSEGRRSSFNNNKVLVGGDNGKTHHDKNNSNHLNFSKMNHDKESQSAPILSQMVNPFDVMPPNMQRMRSFTEDIEDEVSNDAYEEDLRSRGYEPEPEERKEFDDFEFNDWQNRPRPMMMNQRFPRNWAPRNNFRPPGPFNQGQFRPRNMNRWTGPRPQRFW